MKNRVRKPPPRHTTLCDEGEAVLMKVSFSFYAFLKKSEWVGMIDRDLVK